MLMVRTQQNVKAFAASCDSYIQAYTVGAENRLRRRPTVLLSIYSPNIDRKFDWKFFHWHILWEFWICNKAAIKYRVCCCGL